MIENQNYHNNRELENLSDPEEMFSNAIKDEVYVMGDETLPELLDNMLNRDCDRFSILGSHLGGNENGSWQEEYQKMMLMSHRRPNCAK